MGTMSLTSGGEEVQLDEDGFLLQWEQWDEKVAGDLARRDGVHAMGPEHWRLVSYLRDYYLRHGIAPMVRKICKDCNLSVKDILDLFPSGITKGACKVAGLPKPSGCL